MESISDTYYQNYRIKLHNLRDDQITRINELSYARRFLYNWALEYSNDQYEKTGKTPPYQAIARVFTKLKHRDPLFQWLNHPKYNVTTCRYAFIDLNTAFHNFISGKCKHPIFKSRKTDSVRFAIRSDCLTFKGEDGRYAFIPGISMKKGDLIDCGNHNIPFGKGIKYENARIKFDGVDYWLSLSIQMRVPIQPSHPIVHDNPGFGIDVGIRTPATMSDGTTYNMKSISKHRLTVLDRRMRVLQSACDRDVRRRMNESNRTRTKYEDIPKSKNQLKRERRLAKTRTQIVNIYRNFYHNISKDIANKLPAFIVVEDLNIHDMITGAFGNRRHDIYNGRLATLIEYISYKCQNNNVKVIKAPIDYPSSQLCSKCGHRYQVGKDKIYHCPHCGFEEDRDLNAAINLRNYGMSELYGPNWATVIS